MVGQHSFLSLINTCTVSRNAAVDLCYKDLFTRPFLAHALPFLLKVLGTKLQSRHHRQVFYGLCQVLLDALRPDSLKWLKFLAEFYNHTYKTVQAIHFNFSTMIVWTFLHMCVQQHPRITVNKFPSKFAHSCNKLSLRWPSSMHLALHFTHSRNGRDNYKKVLGKA